MTSFEMKSALDINVPHRIPHVSRFALVLGRATERKRWRRPGGSQMVRRGVPFSRYAAGLNVYVVGFRSCGAELIGWACGGVWVRGISSLPGRRGGYWLSAYESDCFGGLSGGGGWT